MRHALKEWDSVCARLASGDACLLLRKGGILERRDGFELEHREFLLFPTRHHASGQAPPDRVEISLLAEAVRDLPLTDLGIVRRLEGFHAVPWPDVEKRFHYRKPGIHAVALRVHRLREPRVLPNTAAYDGCVSWVELEEDLPAETAGPALSDGDFAARLERLDALLAGAGRSA